MHIAELLCLPGSPHSQLSDTTAQVVTSECWGGEDLWGELGLLTGRSSQPWAPVLEVEHRPSLPGVETAMLDLHCVPSKTILPEPGSNTDLRFQSIDQ